MKKIKFIIAILSVCILSSCLNIEEKIVINTDNSGAYSLSIDMSKLLQTMASMGAAGTDTTYKNKKMDSMIELKNYIDTAKNLTAAEKALYRNSTLAVKIDMPNNIMKMKLSCPFTDLSTLPVIKKNLFAVISKLDITKAAEGSLTQGNALPPGTNLSAASKSGNPIAQFFTFATSPGKISYTINNKAGLDKEMVSDSLAQMKQMSMFMGDFSYNTIIILPKAAKKFNGPGSSISADKKTVTFKRTFDDLIGDNTQNLEYSIEY
jgi:hypothetical protein